jgi:hypothetical protein
MCGHKFANKAFIMVSCANSAPYCAYCTTKQASVKQLAGQIRVDWATPITGLFMTPYRKK